MGAGGHDFESPAGQNLVRQVNVKSLGVRPSTLVTLTCFVLPDIENCLPSWIKRPAWHVMTSHLPKNTADSHEDTSLIKIHVHYQKGILEGAMNGSLPRPRQSPQVI
jgi:hypothetical protein